MTDDTPALAPALTPEQWAAMEYERLRLPSLVEFRVFRVDEPDQCPLYIGSRTRTSHHGANVSFGSEEPIFAEEMHALAAFCLYDQPFGFTRQDVALILRFSGSRDIWDSDGDELESLAKRIAALLPPPS